MEADELKQLIFNRTGLKSHELKCPREKSSMTPCIARDGDLAMDEDKTCIGCGMSVLKLLEVEKIKIKTNQ